MKEALMGVCQRPEYRSTVEAPSPWEARLPSERRFKQGDPMVPRHQHARILCWNCPLLDACERYLTEMERQRLEVAGVVAGRYSDVRSERGTPTAPRDAAEVQARCRACAELMWPQATAPDVDPGDIPRRHLGEGLCCECHPIFSRAARRKTA